MEDSYAEIIKELENGTGCRLEGSFSVDKVSGNFHISFHNYMEHYRKLLFSDHEKFMKLNLSFELKELFFGSDRNDT